MDHPPLIRAVLFDLDGTLADTRPGIIAAFTAAFTRVCPEHLPFPRPIPIGPPLAATIRLLAPDLEDAQVQEISEAFALHYDRGLCRDSRLYPGIKELVTGLRMRGVTCAVVTNKREAPARDILAHLNLLPSLALVLGPDSRHPRFPDKASAISAACMHLAVSAGEAMYVGDTSADRDAAFSAGLRFVAARWGYEELDDPFLSAHEPQNVMAMVMGFGHGHEP